MRLDVPLSELKDGESGTMTSIRIGQGLRGEREREVGGWGMERRVLDMGLTPSTRVTVLKSAPFSGPVEIMVRGSILILDNISKRFHNMRLSWPQIQMTRMLTLVYV